MAEDWHAMTADEVMRALEVGAEGLSGPEAAERLQRYGPNELVAEGGRSPLTMLLAQFKEALVLVLIAAALVSAFIGFFEGTEDGLIDAAVIALIVVVNAVLGFVQEYKAEKTLEALKEMASPQVTVVRDGTEMEIASKELVPGDLIILETGDKIPADARLTKAINLKVNEKTLTGESVPIHKDADQVAAPEAYLGERRDMVFTGCTVESGRGTGLVTSTGMETALGRIAKLVQADHEETPLQKKLSRLGKQLGLAVLGIVVIIMIAGLVQGAELVSMFMTAVSLAVAAIPEGLPAVVTISLALGLQRMVKRNALMRRLPAVESLGSATVICSDKTGTLTKGEMNIREAWAGRTVSITGEGFEPVGEFLADDEVIDPLEDEQLVWMLRASALCNDARLIHDEGRWNIRGDTTEGTMLVTARKAGIDLEQLKQEFPRINEVPFDSVKKRMTTVHEREGVRYAFLKGAIETMLPLCTHIWAGGEVRPLTDEERSSIARRDGEMANRALRVLGVAMRTVEDGCTDPDELEDGMTFLGMVGMIDAPRKEAIEAIVSAHRAGIGVKMITGDHQLTARAIAQEMGIVPPEDERVVTGAEMDAMTPEMLRQVVKEANVFARVSPENKVQIVDALKENGEIVAMTGDGANDAPALKKADIGVAMGITGTDVSKEAAEMILTDDNFASIVDAVEEGRGIYANIKKFVAFLLSCNAGEVITMFMATLIFVGPEFLPFMLPIQLLWMNLVTDGLPALALGVEDTDPDVMLQPPRDPKEPPVDRHMSYRIISVGMLMAVCTLLAFWIEYQQTGDVVHARTVAFSTIVMFQLLYVFSMRSQTKTLWQMGLRTNMYLVYAVLVSVALQLLVIYGPGMDRAFGTVPLGLQEWFLVLLLACTGYLFNEIYKMVMFRAGVANGG